MNNTPSFHIYDAENRGAIVLIDKPYQWTSFDVIKKIRNTINEKKIGHAGTLDPLATGLLILCTGNLTKKINLYQAKEKEYEGQMLLGVTTPSYDLETPADAHHATEHINKKMIIHTASSFTGVLMQKPPMYSAIKIKGQKLCNLARLGKEVQVKERPVKIYSFDILTIQMPYVRFRVVCSKGTYIRSLVHDFGKTLQSGAVLTELRRTRIGEFSVADAVTPNQYIEWYNRLAKKNCKLA